MVSIERLQKLTDYEVGLLKDFENRLDTIYYHERYMVRLIWRIKRLRGLIEKNSEKTDEIKSLEEDIQGRIKALDSEILKKFDI